VELVHWHPLQDLDYTRLHTTCVMFGFDISLLGIVQCLEYGGIGRVYMVQMSCGCCVERKHRPYSRHR
jgi:hypothetical protein